MSTITLIHGSCADQTADAVVNAANYSSIQYEKMQNILYMQLVLILEEHKKLFLNY